MQALIKNALNSGTPINYKAVMNPSVLKKYKE